jgi:F-type H+-transporting ATPase subunit delta
MAKKANPRRYAQAVFEIAQENNEFDEWQSDLGKMVAAVNTGSLLDALEDPRIKIEDKARFLRERVSGISPLAMNLALLLVSESGISIIGEIAAEYKKMLDDYRGIEMAEVITAVPLDETDKKKLKTQLSALTGVKIDLKTDVDPGILGGIIARVGGKLLDGSTRSKLAALKRDLEGRG